MRDIMGMYSWLNIATSGIRFGPDQDAVKAELRQHIEDKAADLMRIFPDMEEKEAGKRALAAMGDAWELKKELARVHTPWLGWLWTASRILLWAVLACTLVSALSGTMSTDSLRHRWEVAQERQQMQAVGRALYGDGTPGWEGEQAAVLQVDGEARLGRSVISVSRAARWREPEGDCLYLRLRVTWDRPWETNHMAINYLWAEDNLGNTYELGPARSFTNGWNWYQRDLAVDGFPPEAKELRIHHKLREELDLAVDLTREVLP